MRRLLLALAAPLLGFAVACSGVVGDTDTPSSGSGAPGQPTGGAGGPGDSTGAGGDSTGPTGGTGGSDVTTDADGGVVVVPRTVAGVTIAGSPIFSRFVRLTHDQWEQSVRDLLQLGALPGLSGSFTSDPPGGTFTNNERRLFVTSGLRTDYQRAAETLTQKMASDATALGKVTGGATAADVFVKTFGRRAFRRPLTDAEAQRYQTLFTAGATVIKSGNNFNDGVQLVVEAMLQSPYFLYRTELGTDGQPLSAYEVASKLSFLLRNTTPDDALLDAAKGGELGTPDGLHARAQQMLDAMPASVVFERFHAELFGLDRYAAIEKDATAFPKFVSSSKTDLRQADNLFFDDIFSKGQGLREILQSPVAYVNEATAPFYGLTAQGSDMKPVQLGPERPGFFTRAGFLTLNATLRDPDPIHRGVDINRRLLGAVNLAPPPGVVIPQLPTPMAGQTNRERVTAHTGKGTCGESCHGGIINPIGFAFENFDAIGQVRTTDNGKPVDTSGEYAFAEGPKSFSGAPELLKLMADASQTHGSYAVSLAEFSLARDIGEGDRPFVTSLQQLSMAANSSIKRIVMSVIDSPAFGKRGAP